MNHYKKHKANAEKTWSKYMDIYLNRGRTDDNLHEVPVPEDVKAQYTEEYVAKLKAQADYNRDHTATVFPGGCR